MLNRGLRVSVAVLAWMSVSASQVWACPMCKFAVESDDPKPRAYMYSILFMLCAIGAVVGGLIGFLCWLNRSERAAMNAAGYQHLFENGVSQLALEAAKDR
ncbi:MAG: hypothetical protein JSS49_27700 [Planctomycetes bacterium]|nr:hypothetical protein [Planctomycetota bacterium]